MHRIPPPSEAVALQGHVITAVILREMRTRFGRAKLGYLWALAEPIVQIGTLLAIFHAFGRSSPIGHDLPLFFTTGIVPWLLFVNVASRTMKAIDGNGALLSYPQVTPLDLMIARTLLEAATSTVILTILLTGLGLLGSNAAPGNFVLVVEAMVCITVFGAGVGMFSAVALAALASYEHVFTAIIRPMYFVSGIFFSPDMMPSPARDWLLLNPLLHMVEWTRAGFFEGYDGVYLSRSFAVGSAAVSLFFGMAAERVARRWMRRP
jgi:capsular polysaccharide transport system permease protein